MKFLEHNEIWQWAEKHGLQRGDGQTMQLPDLPVQLRRTYADGQRSGRELTAAKDLIACLETWDECLVRITGWGIWPSGEDWPQFYAWRGNHGERRSLETAPGHQFVPDEIASLTELLVLIMENAWDADVLCSYGGRADGPHGKISHDEWYEVLAATPTRKSAG